MLDVGWELCWDCHLGQGIGSGTSVLLSVGLSTQPLGLSHSTVAGVPRMGKWNLPISPLKG